MRFVPCFAKHSFIELKPTQFAVDETTGVARGILMLDPEYNNQNKGPMMVERVKFRMDVEKSKEPKGVKYLFEQAFDFFCPSWRGIAYIYIGKPAGSSGEWDDITTFTEIKPVAFATPVQYVNADSGASAASTTSSK